MQALSAGAAAPPGSGFRSRRGAVPRMDDFMFPKVTGRALALAACGWLIACGADAFAAVAAGGGVATDPPRSAAPAAVASELQQGPGQALQDAQRLAALERELSSLRELARHNAATVAGLHEELERTRGERSIAGLLVAVLSVLLLALIAWVGWRWYGDQRLKRVGRWFDEHGEARVGARPAGQGLQTQPAAILREGPPAPARLDEGPPLPASLDEHFLPDRGATTRTISVQELSDLHEKACFFRSIGEHARAIALLEAHVHEDGESGALPWLDLLELYHSLGRRADYERLRAEFRQHFRSGVADFDHFERPGASLEDYGQALDRIVALWPLPGVLDVIEEAIFRQPGLPGQEPFSLEAYLELVLLYHLARSLVEPEQGTPTHPTYHDTAAHPLHLSELPEPAGQRPGAAGSERDRLMTPPASARLGVDIDLGELAAASAGASELPLLGVDLDLDLDEPTTAPQFDAPARDT